MKQFHLLSGIILTHDGGQETSVEDLYILVDASENTNVNLGNYDISELERISLYVGVDSLTNHSDPASWPAEHPLAPQFPTMHWGWASGYKFVTLEGFGGPALDQGVELHGLGDKNYGPAFIDLDLTANNGAIQIHLDADYAEALRDIELEAGVIVHSDDLQARDCLVNFKNWVFSESETIASVPFEANFSNFNVLPTISNDGTFQISIVSDLPISDFELMLNTIDGRLIKNNSSQRTSCTKS